jgi:hypothetical protein
VECEGEASKDNAKYCEFDIDYAHQRDHWFHEWVMSDLAGFGSVQASEEEILVEGESDDWGGFSFVRLDEKSFYLKPIPV